LEEAKAIFQTGSNIQLNAHGSAGVGLNLRLRVDSVERLRRFLELVYYQLEATPNGSFCIRQLDASWHGFGLTTFLTELQRWRQRYREVGLERVHHSEDLHYFDECGRGFILVSGRQQVNDSLGRDERCLYSAELEIRIPGVPLDTRAFVKLCEASGDGDSFFEPVDEIGDDWISLTNPIYLEPVCNLVSSEHDGKRYVCGLVTRNPFTNAKLVPKTKAEYSALKYLGATDHIICSLSDWHGVDDVANKYYVRSIFGINIDEVKIFNISCTWDKLTQSTRYPSKPMSLRERIKWTERLIGKYRGVKTKHKH
jgi:hypothetical protein